MASISNNLNQIKTCFCYFCGVRHTYSLQRRCFGYQFCIVTTWTMIFSSGLQCDAWAEIINRFLFSMYILSEDNQRYIRKTVNLHKKNWWCIKTFKRKANFCVWKTPEDSDQWQCLAKHSNRKHITIWFPHWTENSAICRHQAGSKKSHTCILWPPMIVKYMHTQSI